MRAMERWKHDVDDYDRAMILIAVVAISAEKLLRADLTDEEWDLANPISSERLARCNVSSIASATGLNRETTRRKVQSLVEQGLLIRHARGDIAFAPGLMQRQSTFELLRKQLESITRLANELLKMGTITLASA
jgi:predicted transcriptional regulator